MNTIPAPTALLINEQIKTDYSQDYTDQKLTHRSISKVQSLLKPRQNSKIDRYKIRRKSEES